MMYEITLPEKATTSKAALVTGGAVRVGREISLSLARAGFRVAVHYHQSSAPAEQLQKELSKEGLESTLIQADLTRPKSPVQVVERAVEEMGRLDLLVNSAAILVEDTKSTVDLARMKLLNVDAPIACLNAAILFLEHSSGSVVNIADSAGIAQYDHHKAYSRTQSALIEMTKKKALETVRSGVRINAVCPGTVLPPPNYSPDRVARLADAIPMGRIGRPGDVADAVLYLAHASYVTGQILFVDGGRGLATKMNKKKQREF
ncbi:MAG: SDR family oxidoreductase [Proteobacteria bacterium]|nr:SDR family oxidoreductase [Pseudomonadota bacterium]